MQLDRTRIAIRERTLPDIMDLSLRICVAYFWPLVVMIGVVAIPLGLLNWWLIGWMPGMNDDINQLMRYLWCMSLLVFFEAPIVSLLVTLYLGSAMFMDEPKAKEMVRTIGQRIISVFWTQLVLRGTLLAWFLFWTMSKGFDLTPQEFWLVPLALYVAVVRGIRPFITEIILLERNPLRASGDYQMTAARRSSALHNPNAGDLFVRWIMSALVAVLSAVAIFFTIWFLIGTLTFMWQWNWVIVHLIIPAVMWTVTGYFCVVRFLCYLDLRIRREGWEVELIMRAAANELVGRTI